MSRSGYTDDIDNIALINWRGAVASAIRGKRGQAFLREMLAAMDALPEKRLIENDLQASGGYCALGTVGHARGLDMSNLDPEDHESVAAAFGVAHAMACEIMWVNDECSGDHRELVTLPSGEKRERWRPDTPEERFARVRAWIVKQLKEPPA